MKKLSYSIMLMLAVAGVALMNGCGGDDTTPEPDKSPAISISSPANNTAIEKGASVEFVMLFAPNGTSNSNLTSLSTTKDDGTGASGWAVFESNTKSDTTFKDAVKSSLTFKRSFVITIDTGKTVKYSFTIKDADGKTASASISLKGKAPAVVTTPLGAAVVVTWTRCGTTKSGYSDYGLDVSYSSTNIIMKKATTAGATKVVVLASADWTGITTKEALKTKVDAGTDVATFESIALGSATFNHVLGIINSTTYSMVNLTKNVNTDKTSTCGTETVVTGESKK